MHCQEWPTAKVMHKYRCSSKPHDIMDFSATKDWSGWWIYCPGHAGVCGNERADRLASTAITAGLQLGKAEVLRDLRNFLNMDRPEHHSTDCLKEREVEIGSCQ